MSETPTKHGIYAARLGTIDERVLVELSELGGKPCCQIIGSEEIVVEECFSDWTYIAKDLAELLELRADNDKQLNQRRGLIVELSKRGVTVDEIRAAQGLCPAAEDPLLQQMAKLQLVYPPGGLPVPGAQ